MGKSTVENGKALVAGLRLLLVVLVLSAGEVQVSVAAPAPGPKDRCPVCGMFVAKYPDFAARLAFKDGANVFFDGNKDLFRFLTAVETYDKKRKRTDVQSFLVKDYYSLAWVDGGAAWYVAGSDVFGPMGHELIAFGREADAREFLRDHKGKQLLAAKDVTAAVLKGLE